MAERLQKIIAAAGLMSRRTAEEYISAGRVTVNGRTAALGERADAEKDRILVDGKELPSTGEKVYIMLNKPKGYVTSLKDEKGRKDVSGLVQELGVRVYPVGRLDMNSEGLLLMTNDGAFANAMMHPSGGISKLYRVTVQPHATEEQVLQLSSGVVLDDGTRTLPCTVNVVVDEPGRTVMEITLKEGKNREIRRMCEAVGLQVVRLKRNAEGVVKLGMLQPGKYRELTRQELSGLRAAAAKGRAQTRSAAAAARAAGPKAPAGPVKVRARARGAAAGPRTKNPRRQG